jgi:hypothetical protein
VLHCCKNVSFCKSASPLGAVRFLPLNVLLAWAPCDLDSPTETSRDHPKTTPRRLQDHSETAPNLAAGLEYLLPKPRRRPRVPSSTNRSPQTANALFFGGESSELSSEVEDIVVQALSPCLSGPCSVHLDPVPLSPICLDSVSLSRPWPRRSVRTKYLCNLL